MNRRFRNCIGVLIGFISVSGVETTVLNAANPAITIDDGGTDGGYEGQTGRYGVHFTPLVDINVTALGSYDRQNNGLAADMIVGLFKTNPQVNDGVELVRTIVPAGTSATLVDRFRYVNLPAPEQLIAGEKYFLATIYFANSIEDIFNGTYKSENLLLNADKSFDTVLSDISDTAGQSDSWTDIDWMFPGNGPGPHTTANFLFEIVPEPTTSAMISLLTCVMSFYRRVR